MRTFKTLNALAENTFRRLMAGGIGPPGPYVDKLRRHASAWEAELNAWREVATAERELRFAENELWNGDAGETGEDKTRLRKAQHRLRAAYVAVGEKR